MHLTLHKVRERFGLCLKVTVRIKLLQSSRIFGFHLLLRRLLLTCVNLLGHYLFEIFLCILRSRHLFCLLLLSFLTILFAVATIDIHQLFCESTQLERVLLLNVNAARPLNTLKWVLRLEWVFLEGKARWKVAERILVIYIQLSGQQFSRSLLIEKHSLLLLRFKVFVLKIPIVGLGIVGLAA